MKKVLKVRVGKYHIQQGIRCSLTKCPVALAINSLLP